MSRFSIIVPTHDVAGALPDCLRSVLDQPFGDVELIAVVDSRGGFEERLVADAARHDPRLRLAYSSATEGLGAARNAGLAIAEGEFVLFLDGDDTLAPDALAVLDARLAETGSPDLLLFDHERVHWYEGVQGPTLGRLWRRAPAGAFPPAMHPALPDVQVPAWSAAYRRDFVERVQLRFAPGMFTDVGWSVLAALRADRAAVLDHVCVRHLLRRQGRRDRLAGPHHFELLDRFESVMRAAAELKPPAAMLGTVFERLVHEVLRTAASPWRLPSTLQRRRYFRRAARLYRTLRPAGYRRPRGSIGLQHALLAAGAYSAFAALRGAKKRARTVLAGLRRRAAAPALALRARRRTAYQRALARPLDENLAVFSAYWGRGYTCNPAAIHAKAQELAPHIRSVFLVAAENLEHMPDDVESVVIGSDRYWEVMARAKYTFNNVNFEGRIKKRPGSVHVQTQHGTPLKHMGVDQADYPAAAAALGPFGKMLQRTDRWDFNLSSNRHSTEVWERAFPCGFEQLEYGYPRNDAYYTAAADDVAQVRERLGVPEGRIALLYAPTHRDYREGFAPQLDLGAFCDSLDERFVVLLRAHHFYEGSAGLERARAAGKLIDVTAHRCPEDICLAADALITDYSSIMFDYANLDRPIVIYADDWEVYRESRGVYFDLPAQAPGPVVRTVGELAEVFRSGAWCGERSQRLRGAFRERFCAFDDGHAAERVVRRVLLGEPPEAIRPPVPLRERIPAPAAARLPLR